MFTNYRNPTVTKWSDLRFRREFGLGIFLNPSMLRAVRPKELRKMLGHFMKLNQGLIAPGQRQVTPLQAKLHYMKIVTELRSFGGKCFLATLVVCASPVSQPVHLIHVLLVFVKVKRHQSGLVTI